MDFENSGEEQLKAPFEPGEQVIWVRRIYATKTKPKIEVPVTFLWAGKMARIRLESGVERNVELCNIKKVSDV